jgi:peptidase M28-like protein
LANFSPGLERQRDNPGRRNQKRQKRSRNNQRSTPTLAHGEIIMAQVRAISIPYPRINAIGARLVGGMLAYLFILSLASMSILVQRPPAPAPVSVPQADFSSARAMELLKVMALKPHPVGSAEHMRVRDYLVTQLNGLGAQPEIQNTSSVDQRGIPYRAANIQNVLGRLRGTDNSKAVLLVGHYDSVPTGPGASDDGSGVAAILETVRALKSGPPLKNDLIVLFSDGEEIGLLGAQAFINEHPWAKDVGLVLNFEARGNGGAATMFETSNGNAHIVGDFAKAAPYPLANSLSYEIYKLLPNDTDLTAFKGNGFAGLNFAFIEGVTHYHTAIDDFESIDEASLQHQGSYALSLARHFGNLDLRNIAGNNAVYFNVFRFSLIRYSYAWILPLTILVTLIFTAVVVLGLKRHFLRVSGIALGFVGMLISIVCSVVVVSFVWWLVRSVHPAYRAILQGDVYNSGTYMIAFVALSLALTSGLHFLFRRYISVENLAVGALTCWLVLMILTSVLLPGGSFLFTWPLLFSLLALGVTFLSNEEKPEPIKRILVFSIGAIPAIVIVVPIIYLIFLALTLGMSGAVMVLVVLLTGLLIPHLSFIPASVKWSIPLGLAAISVVLLVIGSFTSGVDRNRPQPNSVFYGLDADAAKAVWASADETIDSWTQQFFNTGNNRAPLTSYLPLSTRVFFQAPAPIVQLAAPQLEVVKDETNNNVRTLRLRVTSGRQAPVVSLTVDSDVQLTSSSVNGKQIEGEYGPGIPWALYYYNLPPEGIEVTLVSAKPSAPIGVRIVDQSYGLPTTPQSVEPRPEQMMPAMRPYTDSTFVTKSYKF